ncbi:YitT family protein [Enterococcus dispar ATCC 51266]|uniref:YitT family protein n=2 Tax=Enterococcus TaxID=1350 RepID=S1N727_9ENTE|nr:YitT family protein [Enterococcus dispar ATCC 51266]EOW84827.1 YitT family protein [Enterococcus dispar ATCC 51266]OJG38429.1 YitT family protein [Enterococcus dispar]
MQYFSSETKDGEIMNTTKYTFLLRDLILILIGTCLYAFGLIYINIPNSLAEGGVTGITLILRALFGINPAYSTFILNIPIIILGGQILGKRSFYYTIFGTTSLSVWLFIWQKVPLAINLEHDLLISALLAGIVAGFGSGIVYRVGGTTGGSDVIARILEKKQGISVGRSLFFFDILILLASLTYIDLKKMMYTLIFSYVFANIVDTILDGGYSAKGILVISNETKQMAPVLMATTGRGTSFLKGEGAYSGTDKNILYMVVTSREVMEVKRIIAEFDQQAFISVINVHEVSGEGFTYKRPKKNFFKKLKNTANQR